MRRNQPLPLDHDQLEVQHIDQDQIAPHAQIVEYLHPTLSVEVPEDTVVQVGLVPHVSHAQVARVEAEDPRETNHDQSKDVPCVEGVDWQQQDEPSDHAVDHPYNCHGRT